MGVIANFLSAKNKVASLKRVTLPRLELLAFLLMSKLVVSVRKAVEVQVEMWVGRLCFGQTLRLRCIVSGD